VRTLVSHSGLSLLLLLGLMAAAPTAARARVEVSLDATPKQVSVGDRLTITVAISVSTQTRAGLLGSPALRDYQAPDLSAFEVLRRWSNQSQQISIVNGRAQVQNTVTYYYVVSPRKPGRYRVPAARVTYQSQVYRSNTVTVHVDSGPAPPPPITPGQQPDLRGDKDVYVQVVPDKATAWLGEQVTVTWYVYFRSQLQGMPMVRVPPKADDFLSEDLPLGQQNATRTLIGGVTYGVVPILRKAYFPQRPGSLTIGALTVEARVIGQGFFQVAPVRRASAPVLIRVKPLPTQGRPATFHQGNVGRFRVTAQVKPSRLDARGAASLTVTVSGAGYVHGLKVDRITRLDGFKVRFAGQRTEMNRSARISGKRIHEYLLVPTRTGHLTIPAICFPHFDPTRGAYVTRACSRPLTVTVTGTLPAPAQGASGPARENELRRQIKPILQARRLHNRTPFRLYRSGLRWVLLGVPPLLVLLLLGGRALRRRLSQDTETRRRREARGRARRHLRRAAALLRGGDSVAFFAEIATVLGDQVSGRLGTRVQGLTSRDLRALLEAQGAEPEWVDALIETLEACDFARFAPAAAEPAEMQALLDRTRTLIAALERSRLRPLSTDTEVA